MELFAQRNGVVLYEVVLYGVSGTLGSGLVAIAIWMLIRGCRSLDFYHCANPAGVKWTVIFILMILALCRIVLPGIWFYVYGMIGDTDAAVYYPQGEPLWQMLIFGVILAPVLEELLFRKDMMSLLLKRFSMPWTIGLSALLFAMIHGYNMEGFVSCLLAGILFAVLMARTGSLLACITAHMLCNFESFGYKLLEQHGSNLIVTMNGHTAYNDVIFISGIFVIALCILYLLRNHRRGQRFPDGSKCKIISE